MVMTARTEPGGISQDLAQQTSPSGLSQASRTVQAKAPLSQVQAAS